jgi:hypothetical protein
MIYIEPLWQDRATLQATNQIIQDLTAWGVKVRRGKPKKWVLDLRNFLLLETRHVKVSGDVMEQRTAVWDYTPRYKNEDTSLVRAIAPNYIPFPCEIEYTEQITIHLHPEDSETIERLCLWAVK